MTEVPATPRGLKASGKRLWKWYSGQFLLSEGELAVLRELCRTADSLDALQAAVDRDGVLAESSQGIRAHPALVELRQQRITFARLQASLKVNEDAPSVPTGQTEPDDTVVEGVPFGRTPRGVYGVPS